MRKSLLSRKGFKAPRTTSMPFLVSKCSKDGKIDTGCKIKTTPEQNAVATSSAPFLLVKAGPGSGKTKTVVLFLAEKLRLLDARRIWAVTFSRKAAREMHERLLEHQKNGSETTIPQPVDLADASWRRTEGSLGMPVVKTFHSFCMYVLRKHVDSLCLGLVGKELTVLSQKQHKNLFESVTRKYYNTSVDCKGVSFSELCHFVGTVIDQAKFKECYASEFLAKANCILKETCIRVPMPNDIPLPDLIRLCDLIYADIEKSCFLSNSLSFMDLQFLAVKVFSTFPNNYILNNIDVFVVDESQDTDSLQYRLIELVSQAQERNNRKHRGVLLVGDENQTIYEWRHARKENVDLFQEAFHPCVLPLSVNFRSTKNIVQLSNAIIGCKMTTENVTGEAIRLVKTKHPIEEAVAVLSLIDAKTNGELSKRMFHTGKVKKENFIPSRKVPYKLNDIAILTRNTTSESVVYTTLKKVFEKCNVASMKSSSQIQDNKAVQVLVAYLRIALNNADRSAFWFILTQLGGVGLKTRDAITFAADALDMNLFEYTRQVSKGTRKHTKSFTKPQTKAICGFVSRVESLHKIISEADESMTLVNLLVHLRDKKDEFFSTPVDEAGCTAIDDYISSIVLSEERKVEGNEEKMNLRERVIQLFGDFFTAHSEYNDSSDNPDKLTVSTIHGAKGLEFKMVIILDVHQIPGSMANTPAKIVEEKRCLYVAATRAEEELYLFSTWDNVQRDISFNESKFIKDIDKSTLQRVFVQEYRHIFCNTNIKKLVQPNPKDDKNNQQSSGPLRPVDASRNDSEPICFESVSALLEKGCFKKVDLIEENINNEPIVIESTMHAPKRKKTDEQPKKKNTSNKKKKGISQSNTLNSYFKFS